MQTGPEGWLLAERPVPLPPSPAPSPDETSSPDEAAAEKKAEPQKEVEETKYWFGSLPPATSLEQLVSLAHARWVIEQFYEDAKQECGLDNFQGRRWESLHRHLALVMLAYTFPALQRLVLPLPTGEDFPPLIRICVLMYNNLRTEQAIRANSKLYLGSRIRISHT